MLTTLSKMIEGLTFFRDYMTSQEIRGCHVASWPTAPICCKVHERKIGEEKKESKTVEPPRHLTQ